MHSHAGAWERVRRGNESKLKKEGGEMGIPTQERGNECRRAACTQAAVRGKGVKAQGVKLISPDNTEPYAVVPVARIVPAAKRRPQGPRVIAPGTAAKDTSRSRRRPFRVGNMP